jgi:hypothetical protein
MLPRSPCYVGLAIPGWQTETSQADVVSSLETGPSTIEVEQEKHTQSTRRRSSITLDLEYPSSAQHLFSPEKDTTVPSDASGHVMVVVTCSCHVMSCHVMW